MRKWIWNVLIGIDQLGNAIIGGNPDETISSRIGRLKYTHEGRIPWSAPLVKLIDWGLEGVDPGHCIESIEYQEAPAKWIEQIKDLYWWRKRAVYLRCELELAERKIKELL